MDTPQLSRRQLITGLSAGIYPLIGLRASPEPNNLFRKVAETPDRVEVFASGPQVAVQRSGANWQGNGVQVGAIAGSANL